MEQDFISIIMGVYNPKEAQLQEAIVSILNQSHQNWELILWDDGSDDKQGRFIASLERLDERISCYRSKENKGLAKALNRCIQVSRGAYIARMDADDQSAMNRLARQVEYLKQHPEIGWVGSNALLFDGEKTWGERKMVERPKAETFLAYSPYIHPSVMFKKAVLLDMGGYNTTALCRRCEDYDLFMRLHSKGYQGVNLQEPLFYYREDKEALSRRKMKSRLCELVIRYRGFCRLGIFGIRSIPHILRPILAIFVPAPLLILLKKVLKKAVATDEVRLKTYRKLLEKSSLYAGEIMPQADRLERASWTVLGPTMMAFSLWLLGQARKKGIARLYFLARDGYLPYQITKCIALAYQLDVECRYVYCSRYSLRTPLFHRNIEEALDFICRNAIHIDLQVILKRSGLPERKQQEMVDWLGKQLGIAPTEQIPYAKLKEVRQALAKSQRFVDALTHASRELLPELLAYLKQEGFYDSISYAIVDSGWTGSTQKSLGDVLKAGQASAGELFGFYWGLFSLPQGVNQKQYKAYYFTPEQGHKEKVHFSNSLFEGVFSAAHGMTLGYFGNDKDGYQAYCQKIEKGQQTFHEKLEHDILMYTDVLLSRWKEQKIAIETLCAQDYKPCLYSLLKLFMSNPTLEEVKLFGDISFSDDVFEIHKQSIAAHLTVQDLKDNKVIHKILVMLGIVNKKIAESAWHEGSIVRQGYQRAYLLWQYRCYKNFLYIRNKIGRWKHG